jgi:tyrosine-protein phosphatase YwqE
LHETVLALTARGFQSLIAHPERHLSADLFERLEQVVAAGALIQVTAATMSDPPADRGMRMLAARGLIHVLSSDAHHPRFGREVAIAQGLRVLGGIDPVAQFLPWVRDIAPAAMINGQEVTPPFP